MKLAKTLMLKNIPDKVYERLARARTLRATLAKGKFKARDIDVLNRAGSP